MEIRGTNAITSGLTLSANNVTIRGLAIYGFGVANLDIAQNTNNVLIEQNVLGTTATSFTDPGPGVRSGGANIRAAAGGLNNGTIRNNLIGFAAGRGIAFTGQAGSFQITGNEVRGNGLTDTSADGIDLSGDTTQFLVRGNLVADNGGFGIDLSRPFGGASNNVVVRDPLPGGLVLVAASATHGGYNPATGLWRFPSLAPGAVAVLRVVARVNTLGTVANAAVVSATTFDPVPDNNRASAVLIALLAPSQVSKRPFLMFT